MIWAVHRHLLLFLYFGILLANNAISETTVFERRDTTNSSKLDDFNDFGLPETTFGHLQYEPRPVRVTHEEQTTMPSFPEIIEPPEDYQNIPILTDQPEDYQNIPMLTNPPLREPLREDHELILVPLGEDHNPIFSSSLVQEDDGQLMNERNLEKDLLFPWSKNVCPSNASIRSFPLRSVIPLANLREMLQLYRTQRQNFLGSCFNCIESLMGLSGTLRTPNYPHDYPDSCRCSWFITAPVGYTITLVVDDFRLEEPAGLFNSCMFDAMEIYDNYTAAGLLGRYCGNLSDLTFNSTSNVMTVFFASDESERFRGFMATYYAIPSSLGSDMTSEMTSWPVLNLTEYIRENETQEICVAKFYNRSSRAVNQLFGTTCAPVPFFDVHSICAAGLLHGCYNGLLDGPRLQMMQKLKHTVREQCRMDCHLGTRKQCAIQLILRTIEMLFTAQVPPLEERMEIIRDSSVRCLFDEVSICSGASWVNWYPELINKLNYTTKLMCDLVQHDSTGSTNDGCYFRSGDNSCFSRTAVEMGNVLFNGSNSQIFHFHKRALPQLLECIDHMTDACPNSNNGLRGRNLLGRYVRELIPNITCNIAAARACIDTLDNAGKQSNLDYSCSLLDSTERCVLENTEECSKQGQGKEKEIILREDLRVRADLIKRCEPKVLQILTRSALVLEEGGAPGSVEFKILRTLYDICNPWKKCKAFLDFYAEQEGSPFCTDGRSIKQFGIYTNGSDLESGTATGCSMEITDMDFRKVKRVLLAAKLDYIQDGTQYRNFHIALRRLRKTQRGYELLDQRTVHTRKVEIIDRDDYSTCMVVTDPEIYTFDRRYFVSLNIGGFYLLYRHTSLAYEAQVHASFQECPNFIGSCACAVAVRVDDSVFYVDVCRQDEAKNKKKTRGDITNNCHRNGRNGNSVKCPTESEKSIIYFQDKKRSKFRLYRLGDNDYEVLMPHGTRVTIRDRRGSLNIYIAPSPQDRKRTEGLCGNFDGDPDNDLRLRNGSLLNERYYTQLLWNVIRLYPLYSEHWRIDDDEELTEGVHPGSPREHFWKTFGMICDCYKPISSSLTAAPLSTCDHNATVENCLLQRGVDVTSTMRSEIPSERSKVSTIKKRSAESSPSYTLGKIDSGNWTFSSALEFCTEHLINNSTTIQMCSHLDSFKVTRDVTACATDIMLTGTTDYMDGMLEALKQKCDLELSMNATFSQTEEGRQAASNVRTHLCMPACNNTAGTCENGVCKCSDGFSGADCSLRSDRLPRDVGLIDFGLCDRGRHFCSSVVFKADLFVNNGLITCSIQLVQIDQHSTTTISNNFTQTPAVYLHKKMVACPIPTDSPVATLSNPRALIGYIARISNDAVRFSDPQLFVPHDSRCHECLLDDDDNTKATCTLKDNVCVVDGLECLVDGERSDLDSCLVCQASRSQFKLFLSRDATCAEPADLTLLILMITLSIIIVIVITTFGVVMISKKSFGNVAKKFIYADNSSTVSDSQHDSGTACSLGASQTDSIALVDVTNKAEGESGGNINRAMEDE